MPDTETVDDFFTAPETALAERPENQIVLPGEMGKMQAFAEYLATADIVPAIYKNKPANCFIALEYAQRMGWTAMEVMQGLFIIQGKPSWSSQSLITFSNSSGKYTPIRYEMSGVEGQDDWGCAAYMTEIATGDKLVGPRVTIKMAKDEGWYNKSGSKWKTLPHLMLNYRAAAFLIRTCAPELTMGLHTTEEQTDMLNVSPVREKSAAEIAWESTTEVME